MEHAPGTFDRDIDAQPWRPAPGPIEPAEGYQRLLANPLLSVLSWIIAFGLLRESARRLNLDLAVWGTLCVLVGCVITQFHCLDCGKTGWLFLARAHACPAVVARRQMGWMRRTRGPGLKVQLVMWFIVMTAALLLGIVAWVS